MNKHGAHTRGAKFMTNLRCDPEDKVGSDFWETETSIYKLYLIIIKLYQVPQSVGCMMHWCLLKYWCKVGSDVEDELVHVPCNVHIILTVLHPSRPSQTGFLSLLTVLIERWGGENGHFSVPIYGSVYLYGGVK